MRQALYWVTWNIFLAAIPVVMAYAIYFLTRPVKKRLYLWPVVFIFGLVWLAFLPNTCYLLTEWRHFLETLDASNLYVRSRGSADLTLKLMIYTIYYFCYSGIGMLAFALAIRPISRVVKRTGVNLWIVAIPFFVMLSLGVYLGLILRFNSWDLVVRPGVIWDAITALADRPRLSAFIVAFGGFLWLAYTALDVWIDGIVLRWKETFG